MVKWWAAVAMAEVNMLMVSLAGVYSESSYDENCGEQLEFFALQREAWKIG